MPSLLPTYFETYHEANKLYNKASRAHKRSVRLERLALENVDADNNNNSEIVETTRKHLVRARAVLEASIAAFQAIEAAERLE